LKKKKKKQTWVTLSISQFLCGNRLKQPDRAKIEGLNHPKMERANVVNTEKVVVFVGALFHVINYITNEKF